MQEENVTPTQKMILQAATEVFMQKGFDAAKTTEIAKRAGVTHAMLHYYYRTKEKLFTMIFEEKLKELAESFISVINQPTSVEERIATAICTHIDYLAKNRELPLFIVSELHSNPQRMERVQKIIGGTMFRVLDKFFQEIKREVDTGRIRPINPHDLFMTIISLNLSIFILTPLITSFNIHGFNSLSELIEHRKKENVTIILKYIRN